MNRRDDSSWSQLTQWRAECNQRFGTIHDLPLLTPYEEIQSLASQDKPMLDIGAGVHKPLQSAMLLPDDQYFSMDTDPSGDFDFRSFAEMPSELRFSRIVANQVLEHLTVADAFEMLRSARDHLLERGHLILTVPNASHPVRQWGDATHLTAWPMFDLYSIVRNADFYVVNMARYNKVPLTRNPFERVVVNIVCKAFRVDWCDSLMIVAQKVTENAEEPQSIHQPAQGRKALD